MLPGTDSAIFFYKYFVPGAVGARGSTVWLLIAYLFTFISSFFINLARSVRRAARRGPVRVLGVGVSGKVSSCDASSMKQARLMKQPPTFIQSLFRV